MKMKMKIFVRKIYNLPGFRKFKTTLILSRKNMVLLMYIILYRIYCYSRIEFNYCDSPIAMSIFTVMKKIFNNHMYTIIDFAIKYLQK